MPKICEGNHAGYNWEAIERRHGGRLCGYVTIPHGHPWHGLRAEEIKAPGIPGGITYSEAASDGTHTIGFDRTGAGDAEIHRLEIECRLLCERAREAVLSPVAATTQSTLEAATVPEASAAQSTAKGES